MEEEIKKKKERGREGRKKREGEREGRPVWDLLGIPLIWQIYVTSMLIKPTEVGTIFSPTSQEVN